MWRGRPRARAFPMNNGRGRPFYNPASGENIAISLGRLRPAGERYAYFGGRTVVDPLDVKPKFRS
jgi:hypothetical protein